jgi:hypothetical protein
MTLEEQVRNHIDETMSLEASAVEPGEVGALEAALTGLMVLRDAILMVARRVDAIESAQR